MRKFTAFLLIMMFAGPMIVSACDCCPANTASTGSLPALQVGHDCCPMMEVGNGRCDVIKEDQSLPALQRLALGKMMERTPVTAFSFETEQASSDPTLGPPSFSLSSPLYLTLQVLRI